MTDIVSRERLGLIDFSSPFSLKRVDTDNEFVNVFCFSPWDRSGCSLFFEVLRVAASSAEENREGKALRIVYSELSKYVSRWKEKRERKEEKG